MGLLRFIYAIAVVLIHTTPILGFTLLSRDLAVWSFFIISGFYMGLILNEKYVGKNKSYFLFLSNRFLRIYPVYFVSLILTMLLLVFLSAMHIQNPLSDYLSFQTGIVARVWDFLRNTTLLIAPEYFYEPRTFPGYLFLSQAWTLQLELLFYFFAPFLFRKKWYIVLLSLFVILVFDYRFLYPLKLFSGQSLIYRFFANIPFFLMGGVSYKLYSGLSKVSFKKRTLTTIFFAFLCITLLYNYLNLSVPFVSSHHHTDWLYYAGLLIVIPFVFLYTKKSKTDRLIGELSYPAYIIHALVITFLAVSFPGSTTSTLYSIAVVLITIVLSILLAFFVDRKVDLWRQRRLRLSKKKQTQFYGLFPKIKLKLTNWHKK